MKFNRLMVTLSFSAIILLFAVIISLQSTEAEDVGELIASTETADVGQLTPSTETADVGESSLRIIQPTQASEVLELGKPYSIHKIVMVAERWGQTGMYAYKMEEHRIEKVGEFNLAEFSAPVLQAEGRVTSGVDVTERYGVPPQASIPGPIIVINEGDQVFLTIKNEIGMGSCAGVHVHGVHYDIKSDGTRLGTNKVSNQCSTGINQGQTYTYHWKATKGSAGTWPYHDHSLFNAHGAEDLGLFGAIIVNQPTVKAFIDGQITEIQTEEIQKEFVIYISDIEGSDMYVLEFSNQPSGMWHILGKNPTLVAKQNDIVRFHLLGMGSSFFTFFLDSHSWLEPGTTDIIDTRFIGPLEKHSFVVKARSGGTPGNPDAPGIYSYGGYYADIMDQLAMQAEFQVTKDGGPSIPGTTPG